MSAVSRFEPGVSTSIAAAPGACPLVAGLSLCTLALFCPLGALCQLQQGCGARWRGGRSLGGCRRGTSWRRIGSLAHTWRRVYDSKLRGVVR